MRNGPVVTSVYDEADEAYRRTAELLGCDAVVRYGDDVAFAYGRTIRAHVADGGCSLILDCWPDGAKYRDELMVQLRQAWPLLIYVPADLQLEEEEER